MIGDDSFDFFAPRKGMMSCRGVGCWTLPKTSTRSRRLLLLMLFEVQHLKTTAVKVEKSVLNAVKVSNVVRGHPNCFMGLPHSAGLDVIF